MRGILHIGTEKTGTTSFQDFMHNNRSALYHRGVMYPKDLGAQNHRFLANYGLSFERRDDFVRRLGISSEQDMRIFHLKVEEVVDREMATARAAGIDTVVISSEHLHSRLTDVEQIMRVHGLLAPHFTQLDVYIHLRPQVDLLVSLASTRSRAGNEVRRAYFTRMRTDRLYFNYNLLVGAWEHVFGSENVHCIPFNVTPNFTKFICAKIGLDISKFIPPRRINEALDVRVMAMVNALVDSGSSQRLGYKMLDQFPVEDRLCLDLHMARGIQKQFFESNNLLINRRTDLEPGQLEPNWNRYPEEGNLHILDQHSVFAKPLADLISYYACA